MIVAARGRRVEPVDGPYANYGNPDGYREQCAWSATLGAIGKWCIHPSQVAMRTRFRAHRRGDRGATNVVTAVRDAEARGDGAASVTA
jgi:citrate lyase subunit beta/citryl-CoA lyase